MTCNRFTYQGTNSSVGNLSYSTDCSILFFHRLRELRLDMSQKQLSDMDLHTPNLVKAVFKEGISREERTCGEERDRRENGSDVICKLT